MLFWCSMKRACILANCRNMVDSIRVFCRHHWELVPRSNKNMLAMTFESGIAVDDQSISFRRACLDAAKTVQLIEAKQE